MTRIAAIVSLVLGMASFAWSADSELTTLLRDYDGGVIVRGKVRLQPLAAMLSRDVEARLRMRNRADAAAWQKVKTRADWEKFRDTRLKALRRSLGVFPAVPRDLKVRVTGRHTGDGYQVENLVFLSRPGLVVTANLYRPAKATKSMPGIILSHSHNSSKHTGARQDMAMTWARAGCVVLVPDHLGSGERRQHPFGEGGYHDYHSRYDLGIQLHTIGESLMGWLVWDLMRGVDVLLAQKGVDEKRIILISEPAGGGDVAAVTAALDRRISGVMVQNFGGPQPETAYPLPRDAEESFAYAGSGSWESTRNLRLSARDGFLPWMIVAASAPRPLIYDHEFYWDRDQDPVWKRLQRVYRYYDSEKSLTGVAGSGFVVGEAPRNTHWLSINRELLYPVMERWFRIPNPKKEYSKRRPTEELLCLTAQARKDLKPQPLHELAAQIGADRIAEARKGFAALSLAKRREKLRDVWAKLLGDIAPQAKPIVTALPLKPQKLGQVSVERIHLRTEPGIVVPVVLLLPAAKERSPVVVCLAQQGKLEFLRQRAGPIAELLSVGVAVCLPDVRGTGETSHGAERGRRSTATAVSSSELMLGQSLLGGRLRDLRSVLAYLRQRKDVDSKRLALWGDSFAAVNAPDRNLKVAHNAASRPPQSEPLGGMLALLGALYEDDVRAIYVHGGLSDYYSLLQSPFTYLPHDIVVPGVADAGDICEIAAVLAPRPIWLNGLVDGLNRAVPAETLRKRYKPAISAYAQAKAKENLRITEKSDKNDSVGSWISRHLKK